MNEQQAQEIIHYLATLVNYAMLMDDKLDRLLNVAELPLSQDAGEKR